MPAYDSNAWSSLFFVIFIVVCMYIFVSIFLAVVYKNYRKHMKVSVLATMHGKCTWGVVSLLHNIIDTKDRRLENSPHRELHVSWFSLCTFCGPMEVELLRAYCFANRTHTQDDLVIYRARKRLVVTFLFVRTYAACTAPMQPEEKYKRVLTVAH